MDQRPFGSRFPVIITQSFLMTSTLYLVNIAMQSSSQSCESDIRVPVLRSLAPMLVELWVTASLIVGVGL